MRRLLIIIVLISTISISCGRENLYEKEWILYNIELTSKFGDKLEYFKKTDRHLVYKFINATENEGVILIENEGLKSKEYYKFIDDKRIRIKDNGVSKILYYTIKSNEFWLTEFDLQGEFNSIKSLVFKLQNNEEWSDERINSMNQLFGK